MPTPSETRRFLVCFSAGLPEEAEVETCHAVEREIQTVLGIPAQCTGSGQWWRETVASAGNYDSWVLETLNARDYWTREPRFHGVVLTGEYIGRANGDLAHAAIHMNKPVLYYTEEGALHALVRLLPTGSDSWAHRWQPETVSLAESG